jgi:hypothetical protein
MSQPSALTRREQADRGALHVLRCVAAADCDECVEAGQALAAAWPVKVYQLSDRDADNVYLVRAVDEIGAWAWLAKNEEASVDSVKRSFEISEAVINEAV